MANDHLFITDGGNQYMADMIENIHYLWKAIKPAGAPNIL